MSLPVLERVAQLQAVRSKDVFTASMSSTERNAAVPSRWSGIPSLRRFAALTTSGPGQCAISGCCVLTRPASSSNEKERPLPSQCVRGSAS
eukprot:7387763-Prymnesium_polylepis.1